MPLSTDTLTAFVAMLDTVEGALEAVGYPSSPSPIARVRGTFRYVHNALIAMKGQLETREPSKVDFADIERLSETVDSLLHDKWVTDGFASVEIDWQSTYTAEAAGVLSPPTPLTLQSTVTLVKSGLAVLGK